MKWNDLLSQNRFLEQNETKIFPPDPIRNAYEKDYDRVIFSTYFKRLQNKTQVFPFPENTIIHNRLTHSIEVAVVWRSLGKYVWQKILEIDTTISPHISLYDFWEIVSTACLFHDIWNPPFGHSWESSISDFFKNNEIWQDFIKKLDNQKQIIDFYNFEGNAEWLRIILDFEKVLPLTNAVVWTFLKYPREVCDDENLEKSIRKTWISKKKNWIFQSELEIFKNIAGDLGLIKDENEKIVSYFRHPLAYLVEASDDICYRLMDLEDAVRLEILKIEEVKNMLIPIIKKFYFDNWKEIKDFEEKFKNIKNDTSKMEYLRAKTVWILVELLWNAFFQNYEKIMNWNLNVDLFKCLDEEYIKALDFIKKETVSRVFSFRPVLEIEAAWYKIIWWLLEFFIWAIIYDSNKYRQYFDLLPIEFKNSILETDDFYIKWRIILDYISGMTDNYALNLYKKLNGIELPRIY